jgi:tetratricopeptide (TPR) repeat protein
VQRAVAVAVMLGIAITAGCASNPYAQRVRAERTVLAKYIPAALEATKRYDGEVRVAKVRIYADERYRAQNMAWERKFGDELDYANQLFEPLLGLRLEAEYRKWERAGDDTSLLPTVEALAALDPGTDVAWVIGLTGSLEIVSTSSDELGMARPLSPHIVLRGFSDVAERKMLDAALPDLDAAEREEVYDARRRHKQTVVMLHELAHTLGAIHETDENWIMHGAYRHTQGSISDRNRALMLIALADRIAPAAKRDPGGTAQKLLAELESNAWGGWVAAEKQQEIDQLRNIADAAKRGETASDVPADVYPQFDRARSMAQRKEYDAAIGEIEPLIAAYPANATMRQLVCEIELARGGPDAPAAVKTCGRAIDLAGGDPTPHFLIAAAHLAKRDIAGTRAQLVLVEAKIPNLPKPEAAWGKLAQIYMGMGAITWAEAAVAKTNDPAHPVAAWARTTRARYGVPTSGAGTVKPEEEGDAVAAVRSVLDAVYASKFADATRAAKAGTKKWPKLPGLAAARCDLDLRQEQIGAARKQCAAAIAAFPQASWAQYLMGIIELRGTSAKATTAGIEHLKLALAADPDLAQAWRALAKAYARAKDKPALEQLRADFQQRFGQSLGN